MEISLSHIAIAAGLLIAVVVVIRVNFSKTKNSGNKIGNVSGDVHIGDKK